MLRLSRLIYAFSFRLITVLWPVPEFYVLLLKAWTCTYCQIEWIKWCHHQCHRGQPQVPHNGIRIEWLLRTLCIGINMMVSLFATAAHNTIADALFWHLGFAAAAIFPTILAVGMARHAVKLFFLAKSDGSLFRQDPKVVSGWMVGARKNDMQMGSPAHTWTKAEVRLNCISNSHWKLD